MFVRNPFDEAARERCQEIIKEVVTSFNKNYMLAFTTLKVEEYEKKLEEKDSAEEPEPKQLDTDEAPPQEKVHEGWLVKQGIIRKNWKKRWFVVHHDYRITYAEKEGGEPKGTLTLKGYRIRKFKPKEGEEKNPTIHCFHERKRNWYFQCDGEKDFNEWKNVLEEATKKAPDPLDPEPIHLRTFKRAYLSTREEVEGWRPWYFWCTGNEAEMVSDIAFDRIKWRVLWHMHVQGPRFLASKVEKGIEDTVEKMVNTAFDGMWKGTLAAREELKTKLEQELPNEGKKIIDVKLKVKATLQEKINGPLLAIIDKVAKPIFDKLEPLVFEPIAQSHTGLYKAWQNAQNEIRKYYESDWEKGARRQQSCARWLLWRVDAFESLYWMNSQETVQKLCTPAKTETNEEGDSESSAADNSSLAYRCMDQLEQILKDALFTLSKDQDPNITGNKLKHDSALLMHQQFYEFLLGVIHPGILGACKETVLPIFDSVTDLIGPLTAFINPSDIGEDIIRTASEDAVRQMLKKLPSQYDELIQKGWSDSLESSN